MHPTNKEEAFWPEPINLGQTLLFANAFFLISHFEHGDGFDGV